MERNPMNLLLRPIVEPAATQPFIRYIQQPRVVFDHMTDDDEVLVTIIAIDERKGHR